MGRRFGSATRCALIFCCALGLLPLACGGDDDVSDEQTMNDALREIGRFTPLHLDTAALASAVRAGQPIQLPFQLPRAIQQGAVVEREVQLTLRNLRSPELTEFVLKDGDAGRGSSLPLPPPATYQGRVRDGGAAVFTINDEVVEGSMLVAPGGWSFIEPLEPQLRLRNVDPAVIARLLQKYDHIVYNTREAGESEAPDDEPGMSTVVTAPPPSAPLVMSMVADGDAALFRAYPLDSVMPFWLKQETVLNAVDWLYNCIEPDANEDNAYADCANEFDGGSGAFQARLRIDRLEVWTTGGPTGSERRQVVTQSVTMTHQSSPLCCGEPHTAGQSSLVHFFSGVHFSDGAGEAFGIGGLNYYGPLCLDTTGERKCHHAISQMVPGGVGGHPFPGSAFVQQSLVAHEIGHNNDAAELRLSPVCWLFGDECGRGLMDSQGGFSNSSIFLYDPNTAEMFMAPLLAQQLGSEGSNR